MRFKKKYVRALTWGILASTAVSLVSPVGVLAYAAETSVEVASDVALIKVYNEFYDADGNLGSRDEVYSEERQKTWDWDWNDTLRNFNCNASNYKPSLEGYNLLGSSYQHISLQLGQVNEVVFKYIPAAKVTVKVINEFYDTDGTTLLSREEKTSEEHDTGYTGYFEATDYGATCIDYSYYWIDDYRLDGDSSCRVSVDSAKDQEVIFKYVKKAPANVKIYTELYDTDQTTLISRKEKLSEQYTVGASYDYQAADYAPSEGGFLMPYSSDSYTGVFSSGEDYEFVFQYVKGTEKVTVKVVNEFYDTDGTTLLSRDIKLSEEHWVGEDYYYEAESYTPSEEGYVLESTNYYSGVFESGQTYELVFKYVKTDMLTLTVVYDYYVNDEFYKSVKREDVQIPVGRAVLFTGPGLESGVEGELISSRPSNVFKTFPYGYFPYSSEYEEKSYSSSDFNIDTNPIVHHTGGGGYTQDDYFYMNYDDTLHCKYRRYTPTISVYDDYYKADGTTLIRSERRLFVNEAVLDSTHEYSALSPEGYHLVGDATQSLTVDSGENKVTFKYVKDDDSDNEDDPNKPQTGYIDHRQPFQDAKTKTSFRVTAKDLDEGGNGVLGGELVVSVPAEMTLAGSSSDNQYLLKEDVIYARGRVGAADKLSVTTATVISYVNGDDSSITVPGEVVFGITSGSNQVEEWKAADLVKGVKEGEDGSVSKGIAVRVRKNAIDYKGSYSTVLNYNIEVL